jgi:putative membrane protein
VYFGVPVSNLLGWYLSVYLIYQSFAIYLCGRFGNAVRLLPSYGRSAVLFYGTSAAGNLLVLPLPQLATITDASGVSWKVSGVLGTQRLFPSSSWAHLL